MITVHIRRLITIHIKECQLGDHAKSAVKAFTWRGFAGVDTFVITFLITGHVGAAVGIVGTEMFTKSFLYYVHERVWTLPHLNRLFDQHEQP